MMRVSRSGASRRIIRNSNDSMMMKLMLHTHTHTHTHFNSFFSSFVCICMNVYITKAISHSRFLLFEMKLNQ